MTEVSMLSIWWATEKTPRIHKAQNKAGIVTVYIT